MRSPLATIKNKLLFIACWLAWALLFAWLLHNWGYNWQPSLVDMLASNALLAITSLFLINSLRYYRPGKGKYLYVLTVCAGITALWNSVIYFGVRPFVEYDVEYYQFMVKSMWVRYFIALLVTGCITLMSELWYAMEEQKETEIRRAEAEKLARDAELYNLRRQLQPHFLFNSLNSISALVHSRPEEARKMIQQLSDFLRGTLKKEENQWTSLSEELDHVQLYLDIEKVRFGYRLHTEIVADDAARNCRIPHMLLQPVVENAIKFGLYDTTEPVTIRLTTKLEDNHLSISVQNPFDPRTTSPRQGTGFGLSSVQRRLYLLFSQSDLLETTTVNNQFITTIKIPQL